MMINKPHKIVLILLLTLLIAGCDSDPFSDRGKVFLPTTEQSSDEASSERTDSKEELAEVSNNMEQAIAEAVAIIEKNNNRKTSMDLSPIGNKQAAQLPDGVEEIEWDDLIPDDYKVDPKLIELYQSGEIGEDDPRVVEARRKMDAQNQPANKTLDGKMIKMPGFVVPLELGEEKVTEFLLVPYHGACIHVPPPPTNQTVFVKTGEKGAAIRKQFDTVWVTGRMTIENVESDLAEAGYVLYADEVVPYE